MKNKLKQFRKLFSLTQEQLGEIVGVSRQSINSIETGKFEPSIWLAYDIAKVFKSTIEEIFIFEESQRKSRSEQSRGVV